MLCWPFYLHMSVLCEKHASSTSEGSQLNETDEEVWSQGSPLLTQDTRRHRNAVKTNQRTLSGDDRDGNVNVRKAYPCLLRCFPRETNLLRYMITVRITLPHFMGRLNRYITSKYSVLMLIQLDKAKTLI